MADVYCAPDLRGCVMAKNKLRVDFTGLDAYQKQLEALGGNAVEQAFEAALKESQKVIADSVTAATQPHNKTGGTAGTIIRNDPVEWSGSVAKTPVGFDIGDTDRKQEGDRLASVFLMYGTKVHGQPHQPPDKKLFDAVYGAAIKKRVRQIQEEAFEKVLRRLKAK